jgi:hypothetical protein
MRKRMDTQLETLRLLLLEDNLADVAPMLHSLEEWGLTVVSQVVSSKKEEARKSENLLASLEEAPKMLATVSAPVLHLRVAN